MQPSHNLEVDVLEYVLEAIIAVSFSSLCYYICIACYSIEIFFALPHFFSKLPFYRYGISLYNSADGTFTCLPRGITAGEFICNPYYTVQIYWYLGCALH
mgnify:CR=1 FL=1